jgi:hypothetical protein
MDLYSKIIDEINLETLVDVYIFTQNNLQSIQNKLREYSDSTWKQLKC